MKVQGDKNPGTFSVEAYPPKPTLSLVRFFEDVSEVTQDGRTIYDYDEYQLFVPRCGEEDVTLHYDDWLAAAKAREDTPEKALQAAEEEIKLLRAQIQASVDRQEFVEDCIAEMAMQVYAE